MAEQNTSAKLKSGYDAVLTIAEYYDGPVKGIAEYRGKPHRYEKIFDEDEQEYSDQYLLTPLDGDVVELEMESWRIWRRWELAFHTGHATKESHPSLPEDTARYRELKRLLDRHPASDSTSASKLIGLFDVLDDDSLPKGVLREFQVKWSKPVAHDTTTE